jgi:hypothetical protein
MITELRSPKPVEVEGKGPGLAFALIDRGPDEPIRFLIELKTGELVIEEMGGVRSASVYVASL